MKRLSRSGIEYLTHSWGIYSGCKNDASVCAIKDHCWAKGIATRFKAIYPVGFEPTWYPEAMLSPLSLKKPAVIGVGWVGDLFGPWNNPTDLSGNFEPRDREYEMTVREMLWWVMERCPEFRFVFLTKCWRELIRWSPFPANAWVGATVTSKALLYDALYTLADIEAGGRWLSIEPMLGPCVPPVWPETWKEIDWVVIGAADHPFRPPMMEWVEDLVAECINAGKPVWIKRNLVKVLPPSIPFYVPVPVIAVEGKREIAMAYRQERPF